MTPDFSALSSSTRSRQSWSLPRIILLIAWVICLGGLLLAVYGNPKVAGDFRYYATGAQRILNGQPLYQGINPGSDYVGPPLVIQVVLPLIVNFPYPVTVAGWYLINVAALLASMWMITRVVTSRRVRSILWTGLLFATPLWFSLWLGQINTVILVFVVGAWYAYRKEQRIFTGVLLAIIVWTKFYPGLLILYFAWKRDWRVVSGAMIGTIGVLLFQVALTGVPDFVHFFTDVLPLLMSQGQPGLNHSNHSVLGFAQRLFSQSSQIIPITDSPLLLSITRYGFTALLLGGLLYFSAQPHVQFNQTPLAKFDLEYSLALTTALLLGSTLGTHSLIMAIFPFALLLEYLPTAGKRWAEFRLLVTYILMDIHLFIVAGYLQPPSPNTLPGLTLSLPFFGMLLLWFATVDRLRLQIRKMRLSAGLLSEANIQAESSNQAPV